MFYHNKIIDINVHNRWLKIGLSSAVCVAEVKAI